MDENQPDYLHLGDEISLEKKEGQEAHEKRIDRYGKAKGRSVEIFDYLKENDPKKYKSEIKAMDGCSNRLVFRFWYQKEKYRLIGGGTCKKHLLCAMCALRRSARLAHQVMAKVQHAMSENPSLVPALITTTIKSDPDLKRGYNHLHQSKRKLTQRRKDSLRSDGKRKTLSVTRHINGAVGGYEFKQGAGGHGWHPHSHEIALLEPVVRFVPAVDDRGVECLRAVDMMREISKEWFKITGDSFMVDIRKVVPKEGQTFDEGLMKAVCECVKYSLKMNDMDAEDQVLAYDVLKGRRLTFSYGSLWGIKEPESLVDDIETELELEPYVDIIYGFYDHSYIVTDVTDTGTLYTDPSANSNPDKKKTNHEKKTIEAKWQGKVERFVKGEQI